MLRRVAVTRILLLSVLFPLFLSLGGSCPTQTIHVVEIGDKTLRYRRASIQYSEPRRVSFEVSLENRGAATAGLVALASSLASSATVERGAIAFPPLAPGVKATSTNRLVVSHPSTQPFDPKAFSWELIANPLEEVIATDPLDGASWVPRTAWLRLDSSNPIPASLFSLFELECGNEGWPVGVHLLPPETPAGRTVDFDALDSGQIVDDEFAVSQGVTIRAIRNGGGPDLAVAFDTTVAATPDPDLEDPWELGNVRPDVGLGRVLIVQESGADNGQGFIDIAANNAANGGSLVFNFSQAVRSFGFDVVDIDDESSGEITQSSVSFYLQEVQIAEVFFDAFGDPSSPFYNPQVEFGAGSANRILSMAADELGVAEFDEVRVNLAGSAAVDRVRFSDVAAVDPWKVVINPEGQLPEQAGCVLSWMGSNGSDQLSFSLAPHDAPAEVFYDRDDAGRTTPFPDDYWLVLDATKATGSRVSIPVPERAANVEALFQALIEETKPLDGFSPLGHITIELSEAPLLSTLPLTPEDSLDPLATIGLFDLTPGSPMYGERVPFLLAAPSESYEESDPTTHSLLLMPSIPLRPRGEYGVIVSDRVLATPARPFKGSSFFAAAASPEQIGESEAVARVRTLASDVVDRVGEASGLPIPLEDVALALSIQIRSTDDIPNDLLAIKQQVLTAPPPAYDVTDVELFFAGETVITVVNGRWVAPDWRDGVLLSRDANGVPQITDTQTINFTLALPSAARYGPVPLVMHQHGGGGTARSRVPISAQRLPGFAVIGFTDTESREIPGGSTEGLVTLFQQILNQQDAPDYFVQTNAEQLMFLRLIERLGSLDVLPIGNPDGVPELDVSNLLYEGVSQGGYHGQALMAYAPEIRAAALVTGAVSISEGIIQQVLEDTDETASEALAVLFGLLPDLTPADFWMGLSLFQMIGDAQDPQNHAEYIYRNPFEIAGTTDRPSILVTEGIGDTFSPNNGTRSLAWALGPIPLVNPQQAVPLLEGAAAPVQGNVGPSATAGLVQYVPEETPGIPATPSCAETGSKEGHFCAQTAAESILQRRAFLLSALTESAPIIADPLSDADADGDGLADVQELALGTNRQNPDTDGDSMPDGAEVEFDLDPFDPSDAAEDADEDGLTNAEEVAIGTNPQLADTDSDGLRDDLELSLGTDPVLSDTDGGGRTDGAEVLQDGTNPLDPSDDFETVSLPKTLVDAGGFQWIVSGSQYLTSTEPGSWHGVAIDNVDFPAQTAALESQGGRELVLGPEVIGELRVTRRIFVPTDGTFARILDVLENPTQNPIAADVRIDSSRASGSSTVATSSGDLEFDDDDDHFVSLFPSGTHMANVLSAPGAMLEPDVAFEFDILMIYSFDVTIPAGGRAIVMHFASQSGDLPQALTRAEQLRALGGDALQGLSAAELADIVNF